MLSTSARRDYAPWYVVPANKKWYRNLVIARAITDTLEAMNPQYPQPEQNLDKIVIADYAVVAQSSIVRDGNWGQPQALAWSPDPSTGELIPREKSCNASA